MILLIFIDSSDLSNNPTSNLVIINFNNEKPIQSCSFDNLNVKCIQSNTCNNMTSSVNECTQEDINSVLQSPDDDDNQSNFNWLKIAIAASCFLLIILILIVFRFCYNHHSIKKKLNDDDADIVVTQVHPESNRLLNEASNKNNKNKSKNRGEIINSEDKPPSYDDIINNMYKNIHNNLIAVSDNDKANNIPTNDDIVCSTDNDNIHSSITNDSRNNENTENDVINKDN